MTYPKLVQRLTVFSFLYLASSNGRNHFVSAREKDADLSAGKLRSLGEVAMSERKFKEAVSYYKKAILLEPENAANYFKLFRVHSRMRNLSDALNDISKAVEADPNHIDYRVQKAKTLMSVGQCDEATIELNFAREKGAEQSKIEASAKEASACANEITTATKAYLDKNWEKAVRFLEMALGHMEQALDLLFMKAQAEYNLEDFYGTISDTGKILKAQSKHIEAYQLRGEAYFRLGEHDTAVIHFREGLKLDPEHKGCKVGHKSIKTITKKDKRGDDAFKAENYKEAIGHWWDAMNQDMSHLAFVRPVLLKVVEAHTALGEHDKACEEAQKHIDNMESIEGLFALGDAQIAGDLFQEAVNTFRTANDFEPNEREEETAERLKKAEISLKQSKEKNYYKILGVPRNVKKKELKKAYHALSLKWHPDKNIDNPDKEKAEKMFQDIGEAYEVISDEELREKYDNGEDVFENQGGGGQRQGNAHEQMFRHFQQGGGGGGGGGGRQHTFHFG